MLPLIVDDLAALALEHDAPELVLAPAVKQYIYQELKKHGCQLDNDRLAEVLDLDLDIIVQGLEVWLERR
jgi:hypothetical protein